MVGMNMLYLNAIRNICTNVWVFLQLSPSFTPTSVIRKMYATKDKNRDESARSDTKEDASAYAQDGKKH